MQNEASEYKQDKNGIIKWIFGITAILVNILLTSINTQLSELNKQLSFVNNEISTSKNEIQHLTQKDKEHDQRFVTLEQLLFDRPKRLKIQ